MTQKQRLLFAAVTLAVIVAATVAARFAGPSNKAAFEPEPLAPELASQVDDVASVEIKAADAAFSITRDQAGNWVLPGKSGYRAAFGKIKALVGGIVRAEKLEPKTAKPENYGKMAVGDPGEDGTGALVKLRNAKGEALFALIIGRRKYAAGGKDAGTYVRRPAEARVWLVSGLPVVDQDSAQWLDGDLIEIDRARARDARVEHGDGEVLEVMRAAPDQADFTVLAWPEGATLLSPTAPNGLGAALGLVRFDDVTPADALDFSTATQTVFTTFDGLRITVQTIRAGQDYWSTFKAEFDASLIAAAPEEGAIVLSNAPEDGEAEAADINKRVAGWAYKLPAHKGAELVKRIGDLIRPEQAGDDSAG
ncbi:MAG: DUF4340 domain-containing protein [Sphingomonadales bacterium]